MKYFNVALLALGALYLAIWPHELGHSLAAAHFGCKEHWWQTDASWYLWNSWGGNIDYACLRRRGVLALGATDLAGITANLTLIGLAAVLGSWWRSASSPVPRRRWWFIATVLLGLANYAEAFSYLVVNTLWLSSDMKTVVTAAGISRWPWLALGIALGLTIAALLRAPVRQVAASLSDSFLSASIWLFLLVLYVVAAGAGMSAARFVLT